MAAKISIVGLYRVRREPPLENEVWVLVDGRSGRYVTESDYRERGLLPPIYALLWEHEHKAERQKMERMSNTDDV